MSRALAAIAALAASFYATSVIFRWLGERARWSGYSPDEQARIRADERRHRATGEPDPPCTECGRVEACDMSCLDDPFWRHQPLPGMPTHVARRGEPCGYCGEVEPA